MNFIIESKEYYFPVDIIQSFSDFLPIVEKTSLKRTCKFMYESIKIRSVEFEDRLIKKINNTTHSEIGNNIVQIIKESEGLVVLGGSTISQCLFNEFRSESDIDIYLQYDSNIINENMMNNSSELYNALISIPSIKKIMDLISQKTCLVSCLDTEDNGLSQNYIIHGYHINFYKNIAPRDDKLYDMDNITLQLVFLPDINHHLNDIYDFTFCRNYYDGFNVYSLHKEHVINKFGYMAPWEEILRNAVYNRGATETRVCEHMLFRINKYINRGYDILNYYQRLDEIDEENKKGILRNYYENNSKIIKVANSRFNSWLEHQFYRLSGISMATRTIEVEFNYQVDENIKVLNNNKGNPVLVGEYIDKINPYKQLKPYQMQTRLSKNHNCNDDNSIDMEQCHTYIHENNLDEDPTWADIVREICKK